MKKIVTASLFLALRYLKPRFSLVSVVTMLSVVGPIIGVGTLIVVISVMAGFSRDITGKILGMQAHIQLRSNFSDVITDPQPVLERLEKMGLAASPAMEGPAFIQAGKQILPKFLRGIVPETERAVSDVHENMLYDSSFDIGEDEALIGRELANQIGLSIGDKIIVHSPERLGKMVNIDEDGNIQEAENKEVYVPEELVIAGIFDVGMFEYDSQVMLVHLDKADELFGHDWGTASTIHVRTDDPDTLQPHIDEMRKYEEFQGLRAVTWKEANRRLLEALTMEKNMMFFLLIIIVVVAMFGITSTLVTVAIQKTREIGVLKALGAGPSTIIMVFMLQGGLVGFVGVVGGLLAGSAIVVFRNDIVRLLRLNIFPADVYQLSQIPAWIKPQDVVLIVAVSFALCVLGAVLPALYALRLTPAAALRAS